MNPAFPLWNESVASYFRAISICFFVWEMLTWAALVKHPKTWWHHVGATSPMKNMFGGWICQSSWYQIIWCISSSHIILSVCLNMAAGHWLGPRLRLGRPKEHKLGFGHVWNMDFLNGFAMIWHNFHGFLWDFCQWTNRCSYYLLYVIVF